MALRITDECINRAMCASRSARTRRFYGPEIYQIDSRALHRMRGPFRAAARAGLPRGVYSR